MGTTQGTARALAAVVIAVGLTFTPAVGAAAAAPITATRIVDAGGPKIVAYKNCTALNKVHKGGVAKAGVKYNKVSGKNRAFKVKPVISTALYKKNTKLDRDKDGVACEKG